MVSVQPGHALSGPVVRAIHVYEKESVLFTQVFSAFDSLCKIGLYLREEMNI